MDDLLREFVSETRETLEALSGEVVAWESDPTDRARLDAIFRFVHTVKGSCGFLDLPRLARLSHAAEDVLAAVRDRARVPDTALVNGVLAIVDRIGELVEAIDAGTALDDSSDDLLVAALAPDAAAIAPVPGIAAPASPAQQRGASRSIRLNIDLLDRMMNGMSEMVLARNEVARWLRDATLDPAAEAAFERLSSTVAEMRETVTRTRMQRIEALFTALPRLVRDTAAECGKQVALTIDGGDVELDREMIEMLRDPLVHIIRNSIDHGVETAEARCAIGKPEAGRLAICARQSGNQIIVEIVDDGAGVDTARIAAKALRTGLRTAGEIAAMDEAARLELIFSPGLSSRDNTTALSGRGVGMDVVRANIEQIGGRLSLVNRPGRGLSITIHVPLTLSIMSTIAVVAGGQRLALARQAVEEIVLVRGDQVRVDRLGDASVATLRGERLPLVSLAAVLGLGDAEPVMLVIVTSRRGRYALGIEAVLDAAELVIKPAVPAVMALDLYAGQALPDSGLPMLLLDAAGVARAGGVGLAEPAPAPAREEQELAEPVALALLFDDLDGRRRAIALAVVDRIDRIAAATIDARGDQYYACCDDALLALHLAAPVPPDGEVAMLRLTDGERELGYAIARPLDIVPLPNEIMPMASDDPIAGIALIDGDPVEIIDAHLLFAGVPGTASARPVCLLHADGDGWMAAFLKPTLEAAGYRCVARLAEGDTPTVALAMVDTGMPGDVPTIRLRRERDSSREEGIYRYDRNALLAALADRAVATGRRR